MTVRSFFGRFFTPAVAGLMLSTAVINPAFGQKRFSFGDNEKKITAPANSGKTAAKGKLDITNETAQTAEKGREFSLGVKVKDVSDPTCTITDKPDWLDIGAGCTVTGTPTATGDFSFTVNVADSTDPPKTGSKTFRLHVGPYTMDADDVKKTAQEALKARLDKAGYVTEGEVATTLRQELGKYNERLESDEKIIGAQNTTIKYLNWEVSGLAILLLLVVLAILFRTSEKRVREIVQTPTAARPAPAPFDPTATTRVTKMIAFTILAGGIAMLAVSTPVLAADPPSTDPIVKSLSPAAVLPGYKGPLSICGNNLPSDQVLAFPSETNIVVTDEGKPKSHTARCVRYGIEIPKTDEVIGMTPFKVGDMTVTNPQLRILDPVVVRQSVSKKDVEAVKTTAETTSANLERASATLANLATKIDDHEKRIVVLEGRSNGLTEADVRRIVRAEMPSVVSDDHIAEVADRRIIAVVNDPNGPVVQNRRLTQATYEALEARIDPKGAMRNGNVLAGPSKGATEDNGKFAMACLDAHLRIQGTSMDKRGQLPPNLLAFYGTCHEVLAGKEFRLVPAVVPASSPTAASAPPTTTPMDAYGRPAPIKRGRTRR